MPRKSHPSKAVFQFFRTQSKEVCELTLSIIRDELAMRFKGLSTPAPAKPRKVKAEDRPAKNIDPKDPTPGITT